MGHCNERFRLVFGEAALLEALDDFVGINYERLHRLSVYQLLGGLQGANNHLVLTTISVIRYQG